VKLFKRTDEDRTQNSVKRTRHIWEGIDLVADAQSFNFLDATIEEKQEWLGKHFNEVITTCARKFGSDYDNLRNFNAFVVSNDGRAVLYFEKKK
jgi:hypothetical protein